MGSLCPGLRDLWPQAAAGFQVKMEGSWFKENGERKFQGRSQVIGTDQSIYERRSSYILAAGASASAFWRTQGLTPGVTTVGNTPHYLHLPGAAAAAQKILHTAQLEHQVLQDQ